MNPNPLPPYKDTKGLSTAPDPSPSYAPFRTSFASLSLHASDRIRLLQFPQSDIAQIRNVLQRSWAQGIQAEQIYATSYEFKLRGNPWYGQGSESVAARVLVRELLAYLFSMGWILHATTDTSKKQTDKDTLSFRKQQSAPPPSEWIAISFNYSDRLRLIGAPKNLIDEMRLLLQNTKLLQADNGWKDKVLGAWEFKLNGYPWKAAGEETMSTKLLLLRMLEILERHGWSLYASVDQNTATGEHTSETDSWYCVRDRSWVEGAAVFHR